MAEASDQFRSGWVTVAQASRRLQRSRPFVERLVRDKEIGSEQIAGRLYVDGFDVEQLAQKLGLGPMGNVAESYGPADQKETEPASDRGMVGNGFGDRHLAELRSKYLG